MRKRRKMEPVIAITMATDRMAPVYAGVSVPVAPLVPLRYAVMAALVIICEMCEPSSVDSRMRTLIGCIIVLAFYVSVLLIVKPFAGLHSFRLRLEVTFTVVAAAAAIVNFVVAKGSMKTTGSSRSASILFGLLCAAMLLCVLQAYVWLWRYLCQAAVAEETAAPVQVWFSSCALSWLCLTRSGAMCNALLNVFFVPPGTRPKLWTYGSVCCACAQMPGLPRARPSCAR
jgi:hypothetical protein